jgi:predicted anti-sigma-YlaC factor YlaD
MSIPSLPRILLAGIAGGVALNVIDTPWSILVMVPRLQAFTDAHQLAAHPLVGPWFLLAHFGLATGMAWVYALARGVYGHGARTAMTVSLVLLLLNRAFGLATVLMGLMPLTVFLGFSAGFAVAAIVAGVVAAKIVDQTPARQS